jgi:hypothetical protein
LFHTSSAALQFLFNSEYCLLCYIYEMFSEHHSFVPLSCFFLLSLLYSFTCILLGALFWCVLPFMQPELNPSAPYLWKCKYLNLLTRGNWYSPPCSVYLIESYLQKENGMSFLDHIFYWTFLIVFLVWCWQGDRCGLFRLNCTFYELVLLEQVYLYGAQVTSWKNEHGEELLFLSSKVRNAL